MQAVILSNGDGTRIWPYTNHNKGMLPIGNKPILRHYVETLNCLNFKSIIIAVRKIDAQVVHEFSKDTNVTVVQVNDVNGTADTLLQLKEYIHEDFVCFYGDCYINAIDIIEFTKSMNNTLCLSKLSTDCREVICTVVENNQIKGFIGHPRGSYEYFTCGYRLSKKVFDYLPYNSGIFENTKVGVGAPLEKYLETSIEDMIDDGINIGAFYTKYHVVDVDKPWDIMEANIHYNKMATSDIVQKIEEDVLIDASAIIKGKVIVGKGSYIGKNVIIEGNCIIGENTVIENGAIIGSGCIIGNNCSIKNNCKLASYISVGDQCIIDHTAEMLGGVLFKKVYLYHYGEFYGVIGRNTDLGAGTTCGTLRFDDGDSSHNIKGKRITPSKHGNACFIGDYSRTGVGVILQPGCKIGNKSVVGSGTILNEDVEDNTLIYPRQEFIKKPWGDNKYNW